MSVSSPNQVCVHLRVGLCVDNLLSNLKLDSMAGRRSSGLGQGIRWTGGPSSWEDL